jgi:hypothetical protein
VLKYWFVCIPESLFEGSVCLACLFEAFICSFYSYGLKVKDASKNFATLLSSDTSFSLVSLIKRNPPELQISQYCAHMPTKLFTWNTAEYKMKEHLNLCSLYVLCYTAQSKDSWRQKAAEKG